MEQAPWSADEYSIGMYCEYCELHTVVVTPFNSYMLCPACYALHVMSAAVHAQNGQMSRALSLPSLPGGYDGYDTDTHSYADIVGNSVVIDISLPLHSSNSILQDVLNSTLHERAPPQTIAASDLRRHARESTREQFTCAVCTEEMTGAQVMTLRCGHETCATCMNRWALEHGNTCPFCRELIVSETDSESAIAEEGVQ